MKSILVLSLWTGLVCLGMALPSFAGGEEEESLHTEVPPETRPEAQPKTQLDTRFRKKLPLKPLIQPCFIKFIKLDGQDLVDKQDFNEKLVANLDPPEHYEYNLDAFQRLVANRPCKKLQVLFFNVHLAKEKLGYYYFASIEMLFRDLRKSNPDFKYSFFSLSNPRAHK